MKENSNMRKLMIVMGLAIGLPSTILGVFFVLYQFVMNDVISWNALLIVLLLVVGNVLFLMVKNVLERKNK